jgi:hypothetical protein
LIHPVQQGFETIEPVAPDGAIETHPVDQGRQALRLGAVMGLSSLVAVKPASFKTAKCLDTAGCETPEWPVNTRTVCSPSRTSRSKNRPAGRIGESSEDHVGSTVHIIP